MLKLFSDCSGPCETCTGIFVGGCLAGHGDDDYTFADDAFLLRLHDEWKPKGDPRAKRVTEELSRRGIINL